MFNFDIKLFFCPSFLRKRRTGALLELLIKVCYSLVEAV